MIAGCFTKPQTDFWSFMIKQALFSLCFQIPEVFFPLCCCLFCLQHNNAQIPHKCIYLLIILHAFIQVHFMHIAATGLFFPCVKANEADNDFESLLLPTPVLEGHQDSLSFPSSGYCVQFSPLTENSFSETSLAQCRTKGRFMTANNKRQRPAVTQTQSLMLTYSF